jgi:hypothetical protein
VTAEQEAFFRDLPFFTVVEELPNGVLLVRGAEDKLYHLSPAGTLKPVR